MQFDFNKQFEQMILENDLDAVIILAHMNPDGDGAGTVMGLAQLGFTMYEELPDIWRCSFRSDGNWIDVNELLKPFGGGGHAGASGLRKETDDVDELRNGILKRVILLTSNRQE